jgi:ABC-type uncharacterized transport system ATPase subunit
MVTRAFQRYFAHRQIETIMSKNVFEYTPRDLPLIRNPRVDKILDSSFNNKYGGIHVLVAPSGAGKTTYLRSYANRFINNGGLVQFFGSELQDRKQFYTAFGDHDRSMDLFEMLPKRSTIVFDQIEHQDKLNYEMKSLFKHLAFESRRIEGVSVVFSTANEKLAKEVLSLNGNDKIRLNGTVEDWRWTPDLIDVYMSAAPAFQKGIEEERDKLNWHIMLAAPLFYILVLTC